MLMFERPKLSAALGAVAIAFSAILVRLADVSPATAAVYRCAFALPAIGLLAWIERKRFGPRPRNVRVLAAIAGAFFGLDLVFWHYTIDAVGAGLATVLGNLQIVMVGFIAWAVLGERPNARLIAAVPVVLVGIVAISGVFGTDAYGDDPAAGVIFGILTAVSYSVFLLILRSGGRDLRRPAGPLFDATAVAAAVSLLIGVGGGDFDPTPGWEAIAWLIALALTAQVVGWLLISVSLPRLPAALTSVLLTIQPVGAVIFGIVLLDEAPTPLQLGGVVLILAGVILGTSRRSERPDGGRRPEGELSEEAYQPALAHEALPNG